MSQSDVAAESLLTRLNQIEERLDRLQSERAVAQLMYRYVHACDELKDADRIASFFTKDAVWEGQGNFAEFGATSGRDAIREMFVENPTILPFTAHFLTNADIEISPDVHQAWGRWHTLEAATLKDGKTQVWMAAWYNNDFVRIDGEWLISYLRYRDRFVCPYNDGWAKVRYISPQTLDIVPESG